MQPEEKIQLSELVSSVHELNKTLTSHMRRSENFDTAIKINVDNLIIGLAFTIAEMVYLGGIKI